MASGRVAVLGIMGEYHNLGSLKSTTVPRNLIFLDTETRSQPYKDKELLTLRLGWVYSCRLDKGLKRSCEHWQAITQTRAACEYIESLCKDRTKTYIFGHNIFFDLQVIGIFRWFRKWGWKLDFYYDKGLTYILSIRKKDRTLVAISTTNYYDCSLKTLGDYINLPKLSVDFDNTSDDVLSIYCKRDVEITVEAMMQYFHFIIEHDCGPFAMTRASQAFAAYRKKYLYNNIVLYHDDEVSAFERSAYFGGRCEAFRLGKIPGNDFVSLDINSMYPYVMREYNYPCKYYTTKLDPPVAYLAELLQRYCVIADAVIQTDEPVYPIRQGNYMIFPVGRFRATLCSAAIDYALTHGHIVSCDKVAIYERTKLFTQYIDYFYALRRQYSASGNIIYKQLVKLFLNSLYGKFGQRITETELEDCDDDIEYARHEIIDLRNGKRHWETVMMGKRIIEGEESEGNKSFVAIAAHVTDYARMYLWQIMRQIGLDNVLYCDTDAVKIESQYAASVQGLMDETALGMLKVEHRFRDFTIFGLKDYEIDGKRTLKGVPKSAEKQEDGSFIYKSFLGQASHLREAVSEGFIIESVRKELKGDYNKGRVDATGKILPFIYEG